MYKHTYIHIWVRPRSACLQKNIEQYGRALMKSKRHPLNGILKSLESPRIQRGLQMFP